MSVSYDVFIGAFLNKVTERDIIALDEKARQEIVTGYMSRVITGFKHVCNICDLSTTRDDQNNCF